MARLRSGGAAPGLTLTLTLTLTLALTLTLTLALALTLTLSQALDEYAHRSRNFGGRKEADDNWPMDASASPSGASGHNHRDGGWEGEKGGAGGGAFLRADGVTDGVTDGGGAVRGG